MPSQQQEFALSVMSLGASKEKQVPSQQQAVCTQCIVSLGVSAYATSEWYESTDVLAAMVAWSTCSM